MIGTRFMIGAALLGFAVMVSGNAAQQRVVKVDSGELQGVIDDGVASYKGIPFASTTALVLYTKHGISVGFAYDRKEAKDHGEGGKMVGVDVKGKKVMILDDVMTSGKAVRGSIELVRAHGGEAVGVVQALNREEVGQDGVSSTVKEIEGLIGEGRVISILRMRELMLWLEKDGQSDNLGRMKAYWNQYRLN